MDPQKALPRAVLTVAPTREEYVEASLIAAGRGGKASLCAGLAAAAAALLFAGMSTVGTRSVLLGVLLLAAGALLVLWVLLIEPGRIRKRARAEWEIYQALLEPAQVRLYPDVVETYTQYLTPDRLLCADGGMHRDAAPGHSAQGRGPSAPAAPPLFFGTGAGGSGLEFLRQTFARKRRVKRNWLF